MESLFTLNRRLAEVYGKFETTEYPWFRIVWSNDEYERRLLTHTKDGFELANPMVEEVPKYKQWVADRYILEKIVPVPEEFQIEMGGRKVSYEPLWVFEDGKGNPLAPIWSAVEYIIQNVRENMERAGKGEVKYKDPYAGLTPEEFQEKEKIRLDKLQKELFGNETDITDSLAHDSAVGYGIRNRN